MVMTLHKLTAGDGYLYLVRQVAAADSTERGRSTLADYYSAKGESPGRWMGRGLAGLSDTGRCEVTPAVREEIWTVDEGSGVSEAQMRALYGEGLHPNAERIDSYVAGRSMGTQHAASRLGRKFLVRDGEPEFARRLAVAFRDHNAETGAHWNATIAPDIRAQIRTRVALELFGEEYGRPPADDRELSGFIARNTRARTTAVAGYDLTFSPVKSVSALWAIAPLPVAEQIEAAHDAAVADVLEWLQDQATFTRTGAGGVAQVDTEGLIAAAFTHRDSRAGDPDLHTHVAISNKVSHIDANGVRRWLALDGQPLHRVTVAASELYNTRLEAHMIATLGVPFVEQSRGRGKRPVREIDGMSAELMSRWSSRRAAIKARTAELSKQFQADHGREPTNTEIIALAPTADAAIVLGEDLGATTDTLDKYVWSADPNKAAISGVPDWFTHVGPDTLIVVDEAGKAATAGLDAMIADALRKGASVRLVGDDGQLSSISAGGVLRDIAEATDALTLSEVVRFKSPAEAAAGLALHDADPAGIGFYIDHHRIHVGTDETAADMAYQAWRADLAAGGDSILLAPTNDVINELNARARADRLAADPEAADSASVMLADHLHANVGDTIRTRKNNRRITIGRNDFVRNGYRYTITEVLTDGSVKARHLRSGRIVTLPADYIAEHVTLGYAATIDSAQGLTAGRRDTKGTCHIVGSDMLTRQHLYVAMTRATDENHLYLSTAEGDPHRLLSPKATHPDTAVDVLTRTLARDGAQVSATTEARRAEDPATRLQAAADMFYDALGVAAENQLGAGARDRLDAIADDVIPGSASAKPGRCYGATSPSWPSVAPILANC